MYFKLTSVRNNVRTTARQAKYWQSIVRIDVLTTTATALRQKMSMIVKDNYEYISIAHLTVALVAHKMGIDQYFKKR